MNKGIIKIVIQSLRSPKLALTSNECSRYSPAGRLQLLLREVNLIGAEATQEFVGFFGYVCIAFTDSCDQDLFKETTRQDIVILQSSGYDFSQCTFGKLCACVCSYDYKRCAKAFLSSPRILQLIYFVSLHISEPLTTACDCKKYDIDPITIVGWDVRAGDEWYVVRS